MAACAHMERYGTTSEDFGRLAILCRTSALDNERAMMRKPMTLDDYLASAWISEPFRVFDCCLETDGAVAIAIVSADRARDLPHRPVMLQGAAWGGGVNLYNNGTTDLAESPAKLIAKRLYHTAGSARPTSTLPSCTTASRSRSWPRSRAMGSPRTAECPTCSATARSIDTGVVPVNTHGGLLSEGYLHGFNHVYEAVQQIRGEAEHRQVDRHDLGLVAGQLGYISAYSSALVVTGA